jgi:hypothetical protein
MKVYNERSKGVMQPQRWQDRQISCGKLVRISFIAGAVIILLVIGVFWILSAFGVLSTKLAGILTAISTSIFLLLAFLQWYFPRSPDNSSPQRSVALPEHVTIIQANDQAYNAFIEREREKLFNSPNPHGTGMLVIRADESLVNDAVVVEDKSAIISERTEKGQRLYTGIIKGIKTGNHHATTPHRNPRGFTIQTRDVTEIDWRNGH